MTKRVTAILNPAARRVPTVDQLRAELAKLGGWEAEVRTTERAGHATDLAREAAARGVDALLVCGGDGTMHEAANGLAGSDTALAAVRGGTANVWAKEIKLPKKGRDAVRLLETGVRHRIDLGLAGDRRFLLMAGIGFDAAIVQRVSSGLKRRFGAVAYAVPAVDRALGHRARHVELHIDHAGDDTTPLYWLLLGNTRNYGGILDLTHLARANDGLLDYCLLRHGGLPRLVWLALWAAFQRHQNRAEVDYRKVTSVDITTPGLPVQLDGEYAGETPMTFGIEKNALTVVVPPDLKSPLFGEAQ